MELQDTLINIGISLGLGLLVGMQRERSQPRLGGIRTFALITVLGTVCAIVADSAGGWVIAAGLLGVAAMAVVGDLFSLRRGEGAAGITTEIAMLGMYAVGALLVIGPREAAVVVGAGITLVLHAKPILHGLVRKLGDNDVRAIMQFVLVSLVILPVVPDRTFGPYGVINPHNIWLMVCLVVGISLVGYLLYRTVGQAAGVALAGILGGLTSSTATTVSFSRRAAESPDSRGLRSAVAVIIIAGTIVYGRVMVEITAVAPAFVRDAGPPIAVAGGVSVILSFIAWLRASRDGSGLGDQKNPSELRSAVIFGALYAAVLLAGAAARNNLGDNGLYAVAGVSGLTDMDSITLSVSRMVDQGAVDPSTAWRCIIIAAMSNMATKLVIIGVISGRRLLGPCAVFFGIKLGVAAALVLLWPA